MLGRHAVEQEGERQRAGDRDQVVLVVVERGNRRRAHDALARPATSTCSNCGEVKMPHRACVKCGYYKGREVIDTKGKTA